MVYALSEEQDNFFTTQGGLLFLIVFLIFTYSNGFATLMFIENEYPDYLINEVYPNSSLDDPFLFDYSSDQINFIIQDYRDQVGFRQKWVPNAMKFFYVLIHLHAFMIFKLRIEKPKSI